MTRILPPEITPSDVTSMLTLLDATTPCLDIEKGRAYFELADPKTSPFPVIFVALKDENELSARRAAAEAITVLPYLHAWVLGQQDDPLDHSDQYWLSHLDVGHGEIDVCYVGTVNATWRNPFRKDDAGRWRPLGYDSSVVEMPSPP